MLKTRIPVLLIILLTFCSVVYGQKNGNAVNNSTYTKRLDSLMSKGLKLQNNSDSLPYVVQGFRKLNNQYHDNESAVYADLYAAQHEWLSSNFVKAMQHAIATLNEAQKWKVNRPLPEIYALIGSLHKENTNYPMAFIAAERGLTAAKQNHDTVNIIQLLGMKAMFKRGYSMHFNKPLDKDSSLIIRLQGLALAEADPKYERLRVPFYDNIAQHYFLFKDYKRSEEYARKGIAIATKYNMQRSLTYGYDWLGEASYLSGERELGASYLKKALAISIMIKQPYRKMEIYDDLAVCYSSSSNYKDAYYYLSKYRWLLDSLQVRGNVKQIGELQIKYETAQKDKDLALLNQANAQKSKQLQWLLIGASIFLLLIVILVYTYSIIRTNNKVLKANNIQINEQSAKLQTLMQELHHRVKNNLQIVSSLLSLQSNRMTDNEARDALNVSRQRIEAMSIIHNSLYQHDSANKVRLKEFLPVLVNNIMDSFGIKSNVVIITLEIMVDEIEVDIAMPLGLIINEWVTNIFKHAFKNMEEQPAMEILVFRNADKLKIKIKDNGVGMPISAWDDPKESFGVKLMKILIKQLSGVSYISNVKGTTLELDIPYSKNI